jgi:hypothetical protein
VGTFLVTHGVFSTGSGFKLLRARASDHDHTHYLTKNIGIQDCRFAIFDFGHPPSLFELRRDKSGIWYLASGIWFRHPPHFMPEGHLVLTDTH